MNRKVITYSLLALINNQADNQSTSENIFIPLVKRALAKMSSLGITKGDDIKIIVEYVNELYGLNMPLSILKKILRKIEFEINVKDVKFYKDESFIIDKYTFNDLEEDFEHQEVYIKQIETLYTNFLAAEKIEKAPNTIFEFVDQTKFSLGKYIGKKYQAEFVDHTIEAKFLNFVAPIEQIYETFQSLYIGSVISTYLEYEPTALKNEVELVLDTNFIIALLGLNTNSSKDNCQRLLEIAGKLGYTFTVLAITLQEIDKLLMSRVEHFDEAFLSMLVDPEDIYNACRRRGINKTDLDKIRADVVPEIEKFGIITLTHVEKYINLAKYSEEYTYLQSRRNTSFAALHDATCIQYVKSKRAHRITRFEKVNCWFVNNSSFRGNYPNMNGQPYSIKSEDLLNILWLTSPMVKKSLTSRQLAVIGLSRLVSTTLDDSLPNSGIIQRLDDNIKKYARENITDEDIVRVSRGIAERTISNLDNLNTLAKDDPAKFVESLKKIADEQREKDKNLSELFVKLSDDLTEQAEKLKSDIIKINEERVEHVKEVNIVKLKHEETINVNIDLLNQNKKLQNDLIALKNVERARLKKQFIKKEVAKWRKKAWIAPIITYLTIILMYIVYSAFHSWDFSFLFDHSKSGNTGYIILFIIGTLTSILTVVFVVVLRDKYYNLSIIDKYESRLEIPNDFLPIAYAE